MLPFLNPLFLIGAAAALAPLLLHLMQRRRTVRMPFSTIRFLRLAQKRSARRIHLQHWLLWLMRTLLVLVLSAAFAMPILRTGGFPGLRGRIDRDVVLVIDGSYSMSYTLDGIPVWRKATDAAIAIIEGLDERDRIAVFLAGETPLALVAHLTHDHADAMQRIRAQSPEFNSSRLVPALEAAHERLRTTTGRREREVHILTDHQRRAWAEFGRSDIQTSEGGVDMPAVGVPAERTTIFVTLLGTPAPQNITPTDVRLSPPTVMAHAPVQVDISLARTGPALESALSLRINDREIARRAVHLPQSGTAEVRFSLPPLPPGTHALVAETPPDNLMRDNPFHFLVRARAGLEVVAIGNEPETFFLRAAFLPEPDAPHPTQLRRISPHAVPDAVLDDAACIFLCDVSALDGAAILQLESYVRNGGMLVVFPGERTRLADFASWRILPGTPTGIRDLPPRNRTQPLVWDPPRHPLLLALVTGTAPPTLVARRVMTWADDTHDAQTLIAFGDQGPFLSLRPVDAGHVALFAVSADRDWSDFPLSPFFLPILHQLVRFGAGVRPTPPFQWAQSSLNLGDAIPDLTRQDRLEDLQGQPVAIHATVQNGRTVLQTDAADRPGILFRQTPEGPVPVLAINRPREESDLTAIRADEIAPLLNPERVLVFERLPDLLHGIEAHRIGRTFGEHLLWLALWLAAMEFLYATHLQKTTPGLSESLRVEHSGRIAARKEASSAR